MRSVLAFGAVILVTALSSPALASTQTDAAQPPAPSAASVASKPDQPSPFKLTALQLASGAGAAVVTVPASVALSVWFGSLSNSLVWAALPAVISFVALPPLAVTFAAWWVGNHLLPASASLSPAIWTTLGTQLLVFTVAIALGVHGANLVDLVFLTLVEAVVLPGVSVATMHLSSPRRPGALESRRPQSDNARPTIELLPSLPVVSCAF